MRNRAPFNEQSDSTSAMSTPSPVQLRRYNVRKTAFVVGGLKNFYSFQPTHLWAKELFSRVPLPCPLQLWFPLQFKLTVPTLTWVLSRGEQPCWSTRTCRISLCPYVAAKTTGTTPLCGLEAEYVHKCRYQWGHTHTCMHATHTHTTHSHEQTHTHNLSPTRDCLLGSQPCRVMSSFTRVRLPPQTAWCRQSRPSCAKSREHTLYMPTDMVCTNVHTHLCMNIRVYAYMWHISWYALVSLTLSVILGFSPVAMTTLATSRCPLEHAWCKVFQPAPH